VTGAQVTDAQVNAEPLRIVVADDQASVREGLVAMLGLLPGIDVVGSAAGGGSRRSGTCRTGSPSARPRSSR
jgi:hypothetical protein